MGVAWRRTVAAKLHEKRELSNLIVQRIYPGVREARARGAKEPERSSITFRLSFFYLRRYEWSKTAMKVGT
jgi:hypothetical protein